MYVSPPKDFMASSFMLIVDTDARVHIGVSM